MNDQLHKLEVEELELKQRIRKKELQETTKALLPTTSTEAAITNEELGKNSKHKG